MGFRSQKRIRIFKGLTLNLSKTGTSWTIGGRGASINLKNGKATGNVGIPGTGLSYRGKLMDDENPPKTIESSEKQSSTELVTIIMAIALIAFGYFLGKVA